MPITIGVISRLAKTRLFIEKDKGANFFRFFCKFYGFYDI